MSSRSRPVIQRLSVQEFESIWKMIALSLLACLSFPSQLWQNPASLGNCLNLVRAAADSRNQAGAGWSQDGAYLLIP